MDDLHEYDYELPEELIAKEPLADREAARLLVVDRKSGRFAHHTIRELPALLRAGDCLVLNDTRVVPARLLGWRAATGGRWEGLYLGTDELGQWRLIGHTRGKLQPGEQIAVFPPHAPHSEAILRLTLLARDDEGTWTAKPESPLPALELLQRFGTMPLPPYMQREIATASDWERYQTTFARRPGAVAAPTAGLHFTPELLDRCQSQGISHVSVTLHVGIGTFRPITVDKLSEHRMHTEWCDVPEETAQRLKTIRTQGGRIIAVGTTAVRALESAVRVSGSLQAWQGETDLFIRPPYEFHAIDCLLTNFHLPKSTLLVLVSTLAGKELALTAYREAIRERYRLFSYGDAMLIL